MAKRREQKDDQKEEESNGFKVPKFNKKKFITKEKEKIKATFTAFVFAFIIAVISFGFWILLIDSPFQWTLVLLFGIFSAAWLQYIFNRINIKVDVLERKGMITSYIIYLFSWLFILIVLVNPPVYDAEPPTIDMHILPEIQEFGEDVLIVAKVVDNSFLEKDDIKVSISHNDSSTSISDFSYNNDGILQYYFDNTDDEKGDFEIRITATDSSGLQNIETKTFTYSNDAIKVPEPQGINEYPGPKVGYASTLKFDVGTNISRLYYKINDEIEINVTEQEGDFYVSFPKYEGWTKDSHINITVYADVYHYFEEYSSSRVSNGRNINNEIPIYNNTIKDNQIYYFNVTDDPNVGQETPEKVKLPSPQPQDIPGFELLVFLISFIGVLLIIKYKRSGKKNKP